MRTSVEDIGNADVYHMVYPEKGWNLIYAIYGADHSVLALISTLFNAHTLAKTVKYLPADYEKAGLFFVEILPVSGCIFRFAVSQEHWHDFKIECVDSPIVDSFDGGVCYAHVTWDSAFTYLTKLINEGEVR